MRWAGGKRWLAPALGGFIKSRLSATGTYIEPFLGSGAVYFATQPGRALLSDLNEDLILAYRELADHPDTLIARLNRLESNSAAYYKVRSSRPTSAIGRAARFVYLNRNCYRGIYRENKKGEFNVPFGGGDRNHFGVCDDGTLLNCSFILAQAGTQLESGDFERFVNKAMPGDVVYCDPTYRKVTREHFDRYGKTVFSWDDQKRLANCCAAAYERGATVIISNACSGELKRLYPEAAVLRASRRSGIISSSKKATRDEYLLVLDHDPVDARILCRSTVTHAPDHSSSDNAVIHARFRSPESGLCSVAQLAVSD